MQLNNFTRFQAVRLVLFASYVIRYTRFAYHEVGAKVMQFFSVRAIQIGGGVNEKKPGDQWPQVIERYLTGIDDRDQSILDWPKLSFFGVNEGEFAMIRFEPEINGFLAIGRGGNEGNEQTECFDSKGFGTAQILCALRTLFGNNYTGACLSFDNKARLVIVSSGFLLKIGHENLPSRYDQYGTRLSGLARQTHLAGAQA